MAVTTANNRAFGKAPDLWRWGIQLFLKSLDLSGSKDLVDLVNALPEVMKLLPEGGRFVPTGGLKSMSAGAAIERDGYASVAWRLCNYVMVQNTRCECELEVRVFKRTNDNNRAKSNERCLYSATYGCASCQL